MEAAYQNGETELQEAMDLAYLTGQRPADVRLMRVDDVEGVYLRVGQGKTSKKIRILMEVDGQKNSLGLLIERIIARPKKISSDYLIVNKSGKKASERMLCQRWDHARSKAVAGAIEQGDQGLAKKIAGFQFRDIRPKAASEILDLDDASRLLGHSKQETTKKIYVRVSTIANPTK